MSEPRTYLHAGRCATVRPHADSFLIEWDDGTECGEFDITDETRAHTLARLFVFEGRSPISAETLTDTGRPS